MPGKRGTVYFAADARPDGTLFWFGYWDRAPDGPPAAVEDSPDWSTPAEAVEWGLARSDRVFIRLDMVGGYWWAGRGYPPAEWFEPHPSGRPPLEGIYRPDSS